MPSLGLIFFCRQKKSVDSSTKTKFNINGKEGNLRLNRAWYLAFHGSQVAGEKEQQTHVTMERRLIGQAVDQSSELGP